MAATHAVFPLTMTEHISFGCGPHVTCPFKVNKHVKVISAAFDAHIIPNFTYYITTQILKLMLAMLIGKL